MAWKREVFTLRCSVGGAGVCFVHDARKAGHAFWFETPYFCLKFQTFLTLSSSIWHIMDCQGSISSVVSESGRDWLDLIDTPEDFLRRILNTSRRQCQVQTYFDFPDLTKHNVADHEDESASDQWMIQTQTPWLIWVQAPAPAVTINLHLQTRMNSWTCLQETSEKPWYVLDQTLHIYHSGLSKYAHYRLKIILNACAPKVLIESIDSHQLYEWVNNKSQGIIM